MNGPDLKDVPCLSCQHGYGSEHRCDYPDRCPCDQEVKHVEARLAALRQAMEALADRADRKKNHYGHTGYVFTSHLRAVLAEHATPSAETMPLADLLRDYRDGDEHGWETEFDYLRRLHGEEIERLTASVREAGIHEPILLGTDGRVWDGHHRLCVAQMLGLDEVPVRHATPSDSPQDEVTFVPPPCSTCGRFHSWVPGCPPERPGCGSSANYPTCLPSLGEPCGRCHRCCDPAPASADTEGVRLTEEERARGVSINGILWFSVPAVERLLAARLRAATEGKGEAR